MKRFLALALALVFALSLSFAFVGCDEPGGSQPSQPSAEPLDAAEWAAATAIAAFENVTAHYTIETATYDSEDIAKFTSDKVFRSARTVDKEGNPIPEMDMDVLFEGEDAQGQRTLFFQTMKALLADQANYVYNAETGIYTSPSVVEVRVEMDSQEGVPVFDDVKMENSEIKFKDGKIEYFKCHIVEKIYVNNQLVNTLDGDSVWTFSDYGTTVITESPDEVMGGE